MFKGKKFSLESRMKMSLAKIGKKRGPISEVTREKKRLAMLGKKRGALSQETKEKMRESNKKFWEGKQSIYSGKTWVNCPQTGKRIWV